MFLKFFAPQFPHLENGWVILISQSCSGTRYVSLSFLAHFLALPSIPTPAASALTASTPDLCTAMASSLVPVSHLATPPAPASTHPRAARTVSEELSCP